MEARMFSWSPPPTYPYAVVDEKPGLLAQLFSDAISGKPRLGGRRHSISKLFLVRKDVEMCTRRTLTDDAHHVNTRKKTKLRLLGQLRWAAPHITSYQKSKWDLHRQPHDQNDFASHVNRPAACQSVALVKTNAMAGDWFDAFFTTVANSAIYRLTPHGIFQGISAKMPTKQASK